MKMPERSRGFTLLEVLLAFTVFAMTFALVLEIVAASTRSTVRAKDYSEAALLAQSLAERVGMEFPLEVGSVSGETEDGIEWVIEITDFEGVGDDTRTLELAELNGARLYWVDMTLAWGDDNRRREETFTTVRSGLVVDE
ncbi:MAG: prepilin-type N-terminal cleavage/methylation domain-containing protein [Pseudomonadota bacterium]